MAAQQDAEFFRHGGSRSAGVAERRRGAEAGNAKKAREIDLASELVGELVKHGIDAALEGMLAGTARPEPGEKVVAVRIGREKPVQIAAPHAAGGGNRAGGAGPGGGRQMAVGGGPPAGGTRPRAGPGGWGDGGRLPGVTTGCCAATPPVRSSTRTAR